MIIHLSKNDFRSFSVVDCAAFAVRSLSTPALHPFQLVRASEAVGLWNFQHRAFASHVREKWECTDQAAEIARPNRAVGARIEDRTALLPTTFPRTWENGSTRKARREFGRHSAHLTEA
jgi:hypothetical protein